MAIRSSSEIIREMSGYLYQTSRRLDDIAERIRRGTQPTDSWDDPRAQEFSATMTSVSNLVAEPVETLHRVRGRIDQLADIIDQYNATSFF